MQLDLFSKENILVNAYQRDLNDFKISEAIQRMKSFKGDEKCSKSFTDKINTLVIFEKKISQIDKNNIFKLSKILAELSDFPNIKLLGEDLRLIRFGIIKQISRNIDECSFEFINPGLHPAEIFLETKQFKKAIVSISKYINQNGENTILRLLNSFANAQLRNEKAAEINLVFALFNNPTEFKIKYIFDKQIITILQDLTIRLQNETKALSLLALELWKQNIISLPWQSTFFNNFLEKELAIYNLTENNTINKNLHFNQLFYLAETARLRNVKLEELIYLREKMKDLNFEFYEFYINRISTF